MISQQTISLIIPCRNEEKSLAVLLRKVPACVDEVLVIDNGSHDTTAAVAKKFGAKVIREHRTEAGIGYGFAHQKGIQKATGDIIVTMDGDGTYPTYQIAAAVKHLLKHELDFLSCSRFPLIDMSVISPLRQLGVWILNMEVAVLYGYQIHDILSGMWVVRRSVAKKMQLTAGGWNLSPEIKLLAMTHPKIIFSEFHIHHHYRSSGQSKQQIWKTGFEHLWFIFSLWLWRCNPLRITLGTVLKPVLPPAVRARLSTSN